MPGKQIACESWAASWQQRLLRVSPAYHPYTPLVQLT